MNRILLPFLLLGAFVAAGAHACPLALCRAVDRDNAEKVAELLKAGEDPNLELANGTILSYAAYKGRTEALRALISGGADIERTADNGETALLLAVRGGAEEAVKILLNSGASADQADSSGNTALIWAAAGEELGIAEVLLDAGADIRREGGKGTPLIAAAKAGHVYMVKLLKKRGAALTSMEAAKGAFSLALGGDFAGAKLLWSLREE